jgi:esterase
MILYHKQYFGEGQPLIILHGLFGQQGNWATQAKELSDSFTVYGLDARNHGQSPHADTLSYSELAEDERQTLDSLEIEKALFIGHSMGGKTVMQFALNWPERVSKLLVVDIAPVSYLSGPDRALSALLQLDLNTISSRQQADYQLQKGIPEKAIRDFLLSNLRRDGDCFKWRMNLRVINDCYANLRGGLSMREAYTGVTLFLKGENSDYLMPAYKEQTLSFFPNAQIKVILGSGHWVHSEKPAEFLKMARNFLLA